MTPTARGYIPYLTYVLVSSNPNSRVPTLVVDGVPMFEALAIMQWLGDRYGIERGMWPAADAPERLEALSWSTWCYVTFGAVFQRLNFASSDCFDAALHHEGQAEYARKELRSCSRSSTAVSTHVTTCSLMTSRSRISSSEAS